MAIVWGEPIQQAGSPRGLYAIDLSAGSIRRLNTPGLKGEDVGNTVALARAPHIAAPTPGEISDSDFILSGFAQMAPE